MTEVSQIPPADWEAWAQFLGMHRKLMRRLDRRLQADAQISQADYTVLLALFEAPDNRARVGALGERLAWEKSRVSHQVTRMQTRGLVTRLECDTDGRGTWIELTAEGKRTLLGAMRDHARAIRETFFDVVDADELQAIRSASARVLDRLGDD
ncbi:MarR family transcriptional regulator [Agromyces protaetiae]|uniref:MarR family transcriptional regulator n=1 Tax=Agromyces protaetiae TaxID=2509455 RepID=A0A4P6FAI8_9MICO|nr:MarR family winged helix-turn-helix transcriptional regulator [Agromyces protaetiae]QAY72675.1 MarR family transcriptional regulator [Agromyces protaetiae]